MPLCVARDPGQGLQTLRDTEVIVVGRLELDRFANHHLGGGGMTLPPFVQSGNPQRIRPQPRQLLALADAYALLAEGGGAGVIVEDGRHRQLEQGDPGTVGLSDLPVPCQGVPQQVGCAVEITGQESRETTDLDRAGQLPFVAETTAERIALFEERGCGVGITQQKQEPDVHSQRFGPNGTGRPGERERSRQPLMALAR